MLNLKNTYVSVTDGAGASYGGSQMRSCDAAVRKCGCGAVAALDLLLYLECYHCPGTVSDFRGVHPAGCIVLDNERYQSMLKTLIKSYLPLIPPFGMNGLTMAAGINLFFLRRKMPYTARWGVSGKNTWDAVKTMLAKDIPVIMAVGPNFPLFWQDNKLAFYSMDASGQLYRAAEAKAHFVTVTGIDDSLLQISSWGRRYYIKRDEFEDYVRRHSINYFSSILYVQHK